MSRLQGITFDTYAAGPPEDLRAPMSAMYRAVFGTDGANAFSHLGSAHRSRLWVARDGPVLVGVKWSMFRRAGELHSNVGMVRQSHRRRGIARELMRRQHAWAVEQGIGVVTTNTFHRYLPMLLLNLDVGFELVGVQQASSGLKLLLRRDLTTPALPLVPVDIDAGRGVVEGRQQLASALRQGLRVVGFGEGGRILVGTTQSFDTA